MSAALGVLGGMGPLASAHFLRTIYRVNAGRCEQEMPRVLLDSDPGFPDRTAVIGSGRDDQFARMLAVRLGGLLSAGASRIVIACFTTHHFLDRVPRELRVPVVSLVDSAIEEVAACRGRFLLLCTDGTRRSRVFERAPDWASVADRVVLPVDGAQARIHELIYRMKRGEPELDVLADVETLRRQHGCSGVVLGCTEFHLVSQELVELYGRNSVVDALLSVAEGLRDTLLRVDTPAIRTRSMARR